MASIQIHDIEGKVVGNATLPKALEGEVNRAVLWQAVRMYLANQRQGTADTKTRGEVSGGGRKPGAQKHTGRARAGSIRSPLWRKGGVVFGPHPREHRYELPAQIRRKALVSSLRAKVQENAVVAVEGLDRLTEKTKAVGQFLRQMKAAKGALVVVDRPSALLVRISRNIPRVQVKAASDVNCYDVLYHSRLLVTTAGLKQWEGLAE